MSDIAKVHQKTLATAKEEAAKETDDVRKSMGELLKKIEARCFKLELEKTQLQQHNEQALEEMQVRHRDERIKWNEERSRAIADIKRDFEQRVSYNDFRYLFCS